MATNATYYINAETFEEATAIYTDEDLNNIAPDGYYSDSNISREQNGGLLLPAEQCPTCT